MKDVKLSKIERDVLLSLLKEKEAALRAKLDHYKLVDRYDDNRFPAGLENHIKHDLDQIIAIEAKMSKHSRMRE